MPKSVVEPINSRKNKLNSEIILIFNPNSNAHYKWKDAQFHCQKNKNKASLGRCMNCPMDIPTKEH